MTNRSPLALARRTEQRRKVLGSDNPSCFYCPVSEIECLELEHPVGREHDKDFTRIVCRNCHRMLEMSRDLAGLTKNGKRRVRETKHQALLNFLKRLAHDHQATAELIDRIAILYSDPKEKTRSGK